MHLDIEEHVRVGREARARPRLTGVAALLEQGRGTTTLRYLCDEGVVTVRLGWMVGAPEQQQLDELAAEHDDGTAYALVEALASVLRRDLDYDLEIEAQP